MILGSLLCTPPARLSTGFCSTHPACVPACLCAFLPGSLASTEYRQREVGKERLAPAGDALVAWPDLVVTACWLPGLRSFLACPGCLGWSKTDAARGFPYQLAIWCTSSPTANTIPGTQSVLVCCGTRTRPAVHASLVGGQRGPETGAVAVFVLSLRGLQVLGHHSSVSAGMAA